MNDDHELICPITLEIFRNPVLAQDGHAYEREAIIRWIQQHGTSPFTRQILHVEDLCDDDHLKQLAAQRRKSSTSSSATTETIKYPSSRLSPNQHNNATVHPHESLTLEQTIIHSSNGEKKSWGAVFLMFITLGCILFVTLLLITTLKTPAKTKSCISSTSQITTLLLLRNAIRFNYTYYSYTYKALSSNDMIVFSFRDNSSYWCLDDLSMTNINSKVRLIQNGGFENGVLKPFRFCSDYNPIQSNILLSNTNQRSGVYAFCYKSTSYVDYLIQNLNTTKGQMYNISFWIKNRSGPINKLNVSVIV